MSLPGSLVVVDLETTGANPLADRITELALIRVDDGIETGRLVSLVDPQQPIPPRIAAFTGIDDALVSGAPAFSELAEQVRSALEGRVLVAHNARFDYGFLCAEFERLGEPLALSVMCSLRLSRALFPREPRHGMDALIARHGLTCAARHRAEGDADALWQFLQRMSAQIDPVVMNAAVTRAMQAPRRPAGLPVGLLEGLPDLPGVFRMRAGDRVLKCDAADSLRRTLFSLCTSGQPTAKLQRTVTDIDWEVCAEPLDARLRLHAWQADERAAAPVPAAPFALRLQTGGDRLTWTPVPLSGTDPADWSALHGCFGHVREVENRLQVWLHAHRLCAARLGRDRRRGACSARRHGQCAGVCVGAETAAEHDVRFIAALRSTALPTWPFEGPVVVPLQNDEPVHACRRWHVFDRWCWLGVESEPRRMALLALAAQPRRFDAAVFRAFHGWLAQDRNAATVVPIDAIADQ